jgi:hypothetical protein
VPRQGIIRGASFDRSGRRLLTWNRQEVYLWDVPTRKRLLPVMAAGTDALTAIFSPDESRIASFATTREFTRKFPAYRRAALAGKEGRVRDREGNGFVFRAAHDQPAGEPVSLAEAMGDLLGSVNSGRRKKTLAGYGRD